MLIEWPLTLFSFARWKNNGIMQDMDDAYFIEKKAKAKIIYDAQRSVVNPYFKNEVIFNSDGFHHLQFSA